VADASEDDSSSLWGSSSWHNGLRMGHSSRVMTAHEDDSSGGLMERRQRQPRWGQQRGTMELNGDKGK
jgi:hypothetical protein